MTYAIRVFRAAYDSACTAEISPHCSGRIEEGEEAAYVDDESACAECAEYARDENGNDQQSWAQKLADRSRK